MYEENFKQKNSKIQNNIYIYEIENRYLHKRSIKGNKQINESKQKTDS